MNFLDIISLPFFSSLHPIHLARISTVVRSHFADNEHFFDWLCSLLTTSDRAALIDAFVIDRPAFLPLILSCYGDSHFLVPIL
jgi:hypothetical protein